jgi:2-polyprenyl-3-methyl-5-hydroxy-6-metoxy-1,4-benzoquinol methylase
LKNAIDVLIDRRNRALDLGCGAGVDARYMATQGFSVDAVDWTPEAVSCTSRRCADLPVTVHRTDMRRFKISTSTYDLILAWQTLPFLPPSDFTKILHRIIAGLKLGGLFVFAALGPDDESASKRTDVCCITLHELESTLRGMDFIQVCESQRYGVLSDGKAKWWHRIEGIARKEIVETT